MSIVVSVNERGTLTIPKLLRKKYRLGSQVILAESDAGLVLRPAATYPIEIYSDERIAEFQKHNEEGLGGFDLSLSR